MDDKRLDRMAGAMADRVDRRGVVRLLGAAALGGAGLAAIGGGAEAGRRKRRRNDRCRKGEVLQRAPVPADGGEIETRPLAKGEKYTLRVSGFITDDDWGIDGEYYFLLADPTNRAEVYDACFDVIPVGVEVSGSKIGGWGVYAEDHVYAGAVTGKGSPLTLRLSDCYYPGNTGTLKVEVICG